MVNSVTLHTFSMTTQRPFDINLIMTDTCIFNLRFVKNSSLKAIAHWVRNFGMRFSIFFIFLIHSYQNACNGCENAENRTWSELFLTDESFRGSKRDWHNVRSYLFFNVRKCRTQCAETFSVQWPWIPSKWKVAFIWKPAPFGRKFI